MKKQQLTGSLNTFKKMIAAAVVVAVCTTGAAAAETISVKKDGVNIRSGPGTNYDVIYELPLGYPLKVLSRKDKWLKVSDYENDKGWIFEPLASTDNYVIVTTKEANVRSGPGTNNGKVGSVAKDVILRKVDSQGDWIKVSHPQLTGWIHRKLVWP
jgi:SH3-like domain-containing protein